MAAFGVKDFAECVSELPEVPSTESGTGMFAGLTDEPAEGQKSARAWTMDL